MKAQSGRARKSVWTCVANLAVLVVLASCMSPIVDPSQSATIPVMEEEAQNVLTEDDFADEVECSSLFDLNMDRTKVAMDHNLFWTWHLNFMLPTDDGGYSGCLHFFWRHDQGAPFVAASDYIKTPCSVIDAGSTTLGATFENGARSSFGSGPKNAMRMHFRGESRVECSLDLAAVGAMYADSQQLAADFATYPSLGAGVNTAQVMLEIVQGELGRLDTENPMYYPSFSLGAAVANSGFQTTQPTQPLIYYDPEGCLAAEDCADFLLDHVIQVPPNATVGGRIDETRYDVDPEANCARAAEECDVAQNEVPWFYIMEYGRVTQNVPAVDDCLTPLPMDQAYLVFRARPMTNNMMDWHLWCPEDIAPDIYTAPAPSGLQTIPPYWTRGATIYVGYTPDSGEYLSGDLFEVWLDPDGSGTNPHQ